MSPESCELCAVRGKSVFCNLNETELSKMDESRKSRKYEKGQSLFYEGDHPHGIYCISRGKIKLSKLGSDGKKQITHLSREGDIIGYRALICGDMFSATAEAIEDLTVCYIPESRFFELLKNSSEFSFEILKLLAADLKLAEQKMADMVMKTVRERMIGALLLLRDIFGFEDDGHTLNIIFSREEIANLAGTSTESAIRTLSEFKQEKLIDFNGKKIKLISLQTFAEQSKY